MPGLEVRDRFQDAVLWPWVGTNRYGQSTVGPAQALRVRWNEVQKEVTAADGSVIAISAEVVTNLMVSVGAVLWKGLLSSLSGTDPVPPDSVMTVVVFNDNVDIKGRNRRRTLSLQLHKGTLPTVVP